MRPVDILGESNQSPEKEWIWSFRSIATWYRNVLFLISWSLRPVVLSPSDAITARRYRFTSPVWRSFYRIHIQTMYLAYGRPCGRAFLLSIGSARWLRPVGADRFWVEMQPELTDRVFKKYKCALSFIRTPHQTRLCTSSLRPDFEIIRLYVCYVTEIRWQFWRLYCCSLVTDDTRGKKTYLF